MTSMAVTFAAKNPMDFSRGSMSTQTKMNYETFLKNIASFDGEEAAIKNFFLYTFNVGIHNLLCEETTRSSASWRNHTLHFYYNYSFKFVIF